MGPPVLMAVGEGLSVALAVQSGLMEASLDSGTHLHLRYGVLTHLLTAFQIMMLKAYLEGKIHKERS